MLALPFTILPHFMYYFVKVDNYMLTFQNHHSLAVTLNDQEVRRGSKRYEWTMSYIMWRSIKHTNSQLTKPEAGLYGNNLLPHCQHTADRWIKIILSVHHKWTPLHAKYVQINVPSIEQQYITYIRLYRAIGVWNILCRAGGQDKHIIKQWNYTLNWKS